MDLTTVISILIFLITIAIISLPLIYLYLRKKKEKELLRKKSEYYCLKNGFEYNEVLKEIYDRFLAIKDSFLLNKGNSREYLYEIHGNKNGIEFSVFTFHHIDSDGENDYEIDDSICIFNKKDVVLPEFFIYNSNIFNKGILGSFLNNLSKGTNDLLLSIKNKFKTLSKDDPLVKLSNYLEIEFEDDKKFSEAFLIEGNDEVEVKELLTPNVRTELLNNRKEKYIYQTLNNYLIVSKQNRLLSLDERVIMLEKTMKIFESFCKTKDQEI